MRFPLTFALFLIAGAAHPADLAQEASHHDDIEVKVSLDPSEQSGNASGTVRIHASREVVWSLITSCAESLHVIPGLEVCDVLQTAPDQSWQIIRHVMNFSWLIPKMDYDIRATYDPPSRASIERISGDLRRLTGSWVLKSDGEYTDASYMVDLAPGIWVPHWLVRAALKHDLPKMLRALRDRAEAVQKPAH